PSDEEIELLGPFRGQIPDAVFEKPYTAPSSATKGIRHNLLKAAKLLREAGWHIKDNTTLVDKHGRPFTIEFLVSSASFTRILGPYVRNLERLGIRATIRVVDAANFKNRRDNFDFDIAVQKFPQFLTPGEEQRGYFGSDSAKMAGSKNISGVKNPAVDAMIDRMVNADNRAELTVAARAMDRVLMWNNFVIPHWYKGRHNIAYWNRFQRPAVKPRYDLGVLDTWWYDPKKAAQIEADKAPPPMKKR
ncbi:MAG: ABC transporter substrate-binding protein, partial [Alphaproteobacteria bacterium]|nr:ABC transporter substrate-binding protein [Alphaproteobacteria bacterium]